jgi:glutamine amidotransferase
LYAVPGMVEALEEAVIARGRPFFGICVGMQLMASVGREHGDHPGLGWIAGEVTALAPADPALKIPHMGWNALEILKSKHPVLEGVGSGPYVYFVHGYQFRPESPEHLLARVDYGGPVVAVVGRDNLFGTQFHPEKSQAAGLAIIGNFLRWRP